MAESAAEHRGAERKAAGRQRRQRNAVNPVTELEEHKKPLERAVQAQSCQSSR
jgi:hypothetical protein